MRYIVTLMIILASVYAAAEDIILGPDTNLVWAATPCIDAVICGDPVGDSDVRCVKLLVCGEDADSK